MRIELGYEYCDQITGFTGVATGYVEYITGCHQVLLAPKMVSPGALPESQWFDVQRVVREGDFRIELDNGPNPGSDKQAPRR